MALFVRARLGMFQKAKERRKKTQMSKNLLDGIGLTVEGRVMTDVLKVFQVFESWRNGDRVICCTCRDASFVNVKFFKNLVLCRSFFDESRSFWANTTEWNKAILKDSTSFVESSSVWSTSFVSNFKKSSITYFLYTMEPKMGCP